MILFHLNSLHDNQYNFQIQFDGIDEKRIQTLQFFVRSFFLFEKKEKIKVSLFWFR